MEIILSLQKEFQLKPNIADNIVRLIDEGNTIPFIARYRKEQTDSMDDQTLRDFSERLTYLRNLEKRKEEVITSITAQEKMTDELAAAIEKAATLAALEDIYRPYRPKRRTRASIAAERGLTPLAEGLKAAASNFDPLSEAAKYIDPEKEINTAEEALQGAMDILAEEISDSASIRQALRKFLVRSATIVTKAINDDPVYRMYADYNEPILKIANHRILAIDRGEKNGALKVTIEAEVPAAERIIAQSVLPKKENACTEYLKQTVSDSYSRLLFPSLERELRGTLTERACTDSIKVFAENLKQLLMQPPLKDKIVLGLDPGFAHGCKCAVVDIHGNVLDTGVIYPTPPRANIAEAKRRVLAMIKKHKVTAIAIGNGTASRETEQFAAELLKENNLKIGYMIISEAGASVYSASKLAAAEFPDYDANLRSAVSIARRMQDPLAELIKIDPKAIGVGQYQHDVNQDLLGGKLNEVVVSCVNGVGVELNTASAPLLERVSGLTPALAQAIVEWRDANGKFESREQLKKVKGLGPKAFEQCAGFLRIRGAKNPLDASAVHPERYALVEKMAADVGLGVGDLVGNSLAANKIDIRKYIAPGIGEPTLRDIVNELVKPGRDPRKTFEPPKFRDDVTKIEDVKEGMKLEGVVTNVTAFGAFVDIGVHQDGLIHLSELSDNYVSDPASVVKAGDRLQVTVIGVDRARQRIALSAKSKPTIGGTGMGSGGASAGRRAPRTTFGPSSGNGGFSCNPFANL